MKKILVISLIFFAAFSPLHLNNEYLSSFSEQNSQNATIVQTGEENTTANNKEQSVVLGESVIKKSNLPGFIVFMIIFISLVALLFMIIKKANNKLDSI